MKLSILFLFIALSSFSQEADTLHFYFDVDAYSTFNMKAADKARLESIYKESRILKIEGHCDIRGSEEYNNQLSKRRIETVSARLQKLGFSLINTTENPLGESRAESSGLSMEKCRRVDVIYIPAVIKTEQVVTIEEVSDEPLREIAPPAPVGLSKSAIEAFLEDDNADALQFDLTILFVNVSTRVLEESKPQLFELLEIMQNNPNLNATFHGHVCCQPHPDLAEGRARAVAIFLREYGISADRLNFVGHSNNQPKVWPEVTDEDRKQNRRVAVVFTKADE